MALTEAVEDDVLDGGLAYGSPVFLITAAPVRLA